jgi:glycerol-3-phosphate acyltransferase PlsX
MRVVVDAMGSDRAPIPEVAGALRAANTHAIDITLVGDLTRLEAELRDQPRDRITLVAASEVVTMHDHPGQAFRHKPNSSMRIAVDRGAPGEGDAGANVEPKPSQLAQFGILGAAYDRIVHNRARPRLGLLSNGAEPGKGTPLTRDAHALLSAATGPFQFIGYVEGSDLFRGVVDVIATDGFTGNVVLKTCEGIAEGHFGLVRQELDKTPRARLGASLVAPALRGLAKRIDYSEIGGALLAGVAKPAVIAHGRSDATAICSAIRAAATFAERDLPAQLAASLAALT